MQSFFKTILSKLTRSGMKTSIRPGEDRKIELADPSQLEIESLQYCSSLAADVMKKTTTIKQLPIFHPNNIRNAMEWWTNHGARNSLQLSQDVYLQSIASAWGSYLAEQLGMKWQVITDNYGTELGLYHSSNNVTVFPFSSIPKALVNKDFDLPFKITLKVSEIINASK